jgi:hypothetical protein
MAQLGSDSEQALDELRLAYRISHIQSFHLPLPHHMQRFNVSQSGIYETNATKRIYRKWQESQKLGTS